MAWLVTYRVHESSAGALLHEEGRSHCTLGYFKAMLCEGRSRQLREFLSRFLRRGTFTLRKFLSPVFELGFGSKLSTYHHTKATIGLHHAQLAENKRLKGLNYMLILIIYILYSEMLTNPPTCPPSPAQPPTLNPPPKKAIPAAHRSQASEAAGPTSHLPDSKCVLGRQHI